MMSKEKRRVPKLRFPGFTEDWEQRKLGSIGSTYTGLSGKTKEDFGHGEAKYITYLNVFQNTISNITMTDKVEIDPTQNEVKYGDVLFTTSSETPEEVGMSSVWLGDTPNIYLNSFCFGFRPNQKIDSYFLGYSLRAPYMRDRIKILAQGISRYNISKNKVMELEISLPNNEEQKLLGTFLQRIDLIITLHQRKLDNLKLKKKALLQKLFPKNGERYPELRFSGFTDAWEQRKLNDFGIATGGTSIESEFVDGGDYKVISIGSYSEESVYNDQGLRVNKSDKTKSKILNKDDLTMILNDKTASGNIIGRVLLIDQDNTYVYNQRTERIEVDRKNFLPIFLYHMLNAPEQRKYIVKASQGNTQIYVNWSTVSNINYMIPKLLLEQEKIAKFFSLINKDITLHQRKLDHLQLKKKALLQQMFV